MPKVSFDIKVYARSYPTWEMYERALEGFDDKYTLAVALEDEARRDLEALFAIQEGVPGWCDVEVSVEIDD
jgi:hypothetical protein